MTTAQRVIKYLAIAFAFFLIIGIITTIIAIGSGITSLFENDEPVKTETHELKDDSKVLNIKLGASSLTIKKGEKLKVETNNKNVKVKEEKNKVIVEETSTRWSFNKKTYQVVLYLPEDSVFDDVSIETGAGKLSVSKIESENLVLKLGAGKTVIDNVISNNTKIETGAGELVIKNGKLNNAKIEVGVGKLDVKAEFIGDAKIETGVGSNSIKLLPTENNYKIEFKKGLGSIKYNGKEVSDGSIIGEGSNLIKIEGGIGSINVKEEN
jgi:DUF4097 and DUF4098 domain-containing protein YvlB